MDKEEKFISILEKIPREILIKCAEKLLFKKNPLELELENLTKSLRDPNLEDIESVMTKILKIKEQLKHVTSKTSGILIIPGAKYYDDNKYFSIEVKQNGISIQYRDLNAILKNNSLDELDKILIYLGESLNNIEKNELYIQDKYIKESIDFQYSKDYKDLKNKKLMRIRDLVKEKLGGKETKSNCVSRSKVPLRDYQIKAIKFINDPTQKSLLVVHGTGTGKTLTALTASQCFLDMYPNDKILVISPASLTGNFEKEMKKYGGKLSSNYNFYSFTKFTSLNKGAFKTPFDIYYEDEIESYRKFNKTANSDEIRYLMSKHFNEIIKPSNNFPEYKDRANKINIKNQYNCNNTMVIIDEAHNMRNMGAGYDAVFKCVIQSKKLLLLTATPYVNTLHDFVPIINMLYRDESILDKSKKKISKKITNEAKYFKTLENIFDMLRGKVTYLNDKNPDFFPSVKFHKKEITMTSDFFEKYETALVSDRQFGDAPEAFYNGFRRAVNAVGQEEYVNQKLNIILELIKKGRQTLVFTNWIEAGVNVLENTFIENDISYNIISGNVLASGRLEIVETFNNKKYQVLIITLAGSEGLDLKEVRDVIILDPVWNGAVMEQIIGRAVRFKSHINLPLSERKVDVYNMILKTPKDADIPSGDEILYKFIYEKNKQLDDVIKILKNASI
jgi:superfamily II DNA or RNA helicase